MPYIYQQENELVAPEGYAPFYINYLGRHSGRCLGNRAEAEWICTILSCAYEHKSLTIRGLELLSKLLNLLVLEKDTDGEMNPVGVKNLEEIAHRMYLNYPEVFCRTVYATSTNEVRTIKSRNVFMKELSRYIGSEKISIRTNGVVDPVLRFCEWNRDYLEYLKNGTWKKELELFEARNHSMAEHILERIFHHDFFRYHCLNEEEKNRFVSQLYQLYTNQVDTNGVISLGYYFTPQERYYYWENINLKQYLLMGPGMNLEGGWSRIAKPLLSEVLVNCEEAVRNQKKSADIQFAHAQTLMAFIALLQLPGLSETINNRYKVSLLWKNYQIAPMAANLQWIFYEKKGKVARKEEDVLVHLKHNEIPVAFPIPAVTEGFYGWTEIKNYYQKMLKQRSDTV